MAGFRNRRETNAPVPYFEFAQDFLKGIKRYQGELTDASPTARDFIDLEQAAGVERCQRVCKILKKAKDISLHFPKDRLAVS